MNIRQSLLVLFTLTHISAAKFQYTYDGTASYGVQECIANSNFTASNISLKGNCGPAFQCVMENIPSHLQSILSSGSAILGFTPTVLLVLGNSNEKLVRMNAQYPLLAFLLSIASINKRSETVATVHQSSSRSVDLGQYGYVQRVSRTSYVGIAAAHVLAAAGAAAVIWQTVDVGRKSVVSWACWTDFYPTLWVCLAILQHLLAVTSLRLSLTVSKAKSEDLHVEKHSTKQSGLARWNLLQKDWKVELAYRRIARWSKAFADLLNNLNFLYGTAIFSSLTLVSGHNAIKIMVTYGAIAVFARITAVWVLEEMDEVD